MNRREKEMYCSECGAVVKAGDKYCPECGNIVKSEDIEKELNVQQAVSNAGIEKKIIQRKEMPKVTLFHKILITESILFLILLFAAGSYVKKLVSPEYIASAYFEGMTEGNFDFVYENTKITENAFLTKEMFKKYADVWDGEAVTSHYVECGLEEAFNPDRVVTYVFYHKADDAKEKTYRLTLEKQQEKKYFFFDTWKVVADHLIETDCTLYAPEGAEVVIGGITLDSSYQNKEESEYGEVKYELPAMFKGKYDICITQSGKQNYQGILDVENEINNYFLNYEDETMETLQKQAGEAAMTYLQALTKKSEFSVIEELVMKDKEVVQQVEEHYNTELAQREDIIRVEELKVYDVSSAVRELDNCEITFEVSYLYDEKYVTDSFWFGEWERENEESKGVVYVSYRQENGEWRISDIK